MKKLVPLVLALLLLPIVAQAGIERLEPAAHTGHSDALFAVQGSNTIGSTLMKNLLVDFLQSAGAGDIRVLGLQRQNEYRVQASLGGRRVHVDVAAHGSSTGFRALEAGSAGLAMASRRINESEVKKLRHLGELRSHDHEHVIGIDGLAIIVHPDNPLKHLNFLQLAQIFSGAVDNWSRLGGEDRAIRVYARDENSGTWETFQNLVLGDDYQLSSAARRFESNDDLSAQVASDAGAIGFVGLASVGNAASLAIGEQGTRALRPERLVVATEDYALSRRLFLYSGGEPGAVLQDFLAYVQSDRGQQEVERTGFVSQNLISVPGQVEADAPPLYSSLQQSGRRLSANLRFTEGSAELDNKALRDIDRILAYMARPENQGKQIVLVGFGDEEQSEQRALILSKLRASAVKSALFRRGLPSEPVIGLGAYRPVASNADAGRSKNRRVEVWLRD